MKKVVDYYSSKRPDIAEFVPNSVTTILDVGCGYGYFLKYIKEITNAETWGIEMVQEVAEETQKVVDKVVCSKIEDAVSLLPDNYFDCITFNDVLEHIIDPEHILRLIRPKLANKGVLIASIPNVRYFENILNLLIKKDWKYEDEGVLDNTHLRFFTKKSMQRLFEMAGYNLVIQKGINKSRNDVLRLLNFVTLNYIEDTRYKQYICVVNKS